MAGLLARRSLWLLGSGNFVRTARCIIHTPSTSYSPHVRPCYKHRWTYPRFLTSHPEPVVLTTEWASPSKDDIHVADSKVIKPSGQVEFTGKMFSDFPLDPEVVARLDKLGFNKAFEVQDKTLSLTLDGRDVIGRAITGSGKTLAFAIPIVHILKKSERSNQPRAIVITPTRELCNQVHRSIQDISGGVRCVSIYGGDSYERQENALRRGVDVICATPGRLNDHLQRGNFDLNAIQFLVLDEADELLTPGFKEQISHILDDCPPEKQMMLFSATIPPDIRRITRKFMKEPVVVDLVTNRSLVPESIVHEAIRVPNYHKRAVVADLLLTHQPTRAIVFTSSRADTMDMAKELTAMGIDADPINSDLPQKARERCLENFRRGRTTVLVATDVAARGIDVPETDMVIQVDPPPSGLDFYIHRSGRTGRKGQSGRSVMVLSSDFRHRGGNEMNPEAFLRDLKRNKINVKIIAPPAESDVVKAMIEHAGVRLSKIDQQTLEVTKPHAERLLAENGVDALAAALAVLSNFNVRRRRSMEIERNKEQRYKNRYNNDRPRRRDRNRSEYSHRDSFYSGDRNRSSRYKNYDGGNRGGPGFESHGQRRDNEWNDRPRRPRQQYQNDWD